MMKRGLGVLPTHSSRESDDKFRFTDMKARPRSRGSGRATVQIVVGSVAFVGAFLYFMVTASRQSLDAGDGLGDWFNVQADVESRIDVVSKELDEVYHRIEALEKKQARSESGFGKAQIDVSIRNSEAAVTAAQLRAPPFPKTEIGLLNLASANSADVAARALGSGQPGNSTAEERRTAVRQAMSHAWGGYRKYAFGEDELEPSSKRGKNPFGHLGATIIDGMDTLWIMGLHDEFKEARDWISVNLEERINSAPYQSFFECTIRVLGGLMSAYYLSGDDIFLEKAKHVGGKLSMAFDTPMGIPHGEVKLGSGAHRNSGWLHDRSVLAEFGTTQLEFAALARETQDMTFAELSFRPVKMLSEKYPTRGLIPIYMQTNTGDLVMGSKVCFGAMGDSYYEYLIKLWIQTGGTSEPLPYDPMVMWVQAIDEMIEFLVKTSPAGEMYIAEGRTLTEGHVDALDHKMDHLACFVPGMLALGVSRGEGALPEGRAEGYMKVAEGLMETCYAMYTTQATGLAPEIVRFGEAMRVDNPVNLLRPETAESLMIMYRVTGDEKYREWGWIIFKAFETHCRVEAGYAGLRDVTANPPSQDNTMQSFWLAETLKYLYLLFSPPDVIALDEWVFNTEAHPLMIARREGE